MKLAFCKESQNVLLWAMHRTSLSGHTPNPDCVLQGSLTPTLQDGEVRAGRCYRDLLGREWRSWDPNPALSEALSTHFLLRPSDLQQLWGINPFLSQHYFPHFWKGVRSGPPSLLGGIAKSNAIKDEMTNGQCAQASQSKPFRLQKGKLRPREKD